MSDTITLTGEELDQRIREAVLQAVAAVTMPTETAPEAEKSPRSLRAFDVTDSEKVAKSKIGKATSKFWGDAGPHGPASFRMRKRIAAFADLSTTAVSDRVFRGPLTRAQATTASAVLETGRSVKIDDLEIDAK